jgi:hypothetical protein
VRGVVSACRYRVAGSPIYAGHTVLEGSAVDLENDEQVQRIYLGIGSAGEIVAPATSPGRVQA